MTQVELTKITSEYKGIILAIDPGETSGLVVFDYPSVKLSKQMKSLEIPKVCNTIQKLINKYKPTIIVIEDYLVYPWKATQQSWSSLYTVRLIGAVELLAYQNKLKLVKQKAQIGKRIKNKHLKKWNLFKPRSPHANDALRHAVMYCLNPKRHKL